MTNFNLSYDSEYTHVFHSPGIEPWITGALKGRKLKKVIDVGCGFGLASVILKSYLGAEYLVGLDVDDVKVSKASLCMMRLQWLMPVSCLLEIMSLT
ncbi:MAG: 50S ribosomal protein L11 methyltransferase [Nitrososphaerota archaeon]